MKFTRTKKILFTNNKGGVGKTTLAFNCAMSFAKQGYKTVLVDLDPQCNLSRLAVGDNEYEKTLFSSAEKDVFDVLRGVIEGGSDIDLSVPFISVKNGIGNLFLLKGSVNLSLYENLLVSAYGLAASGQQLGYFQTSAIDRFLREKGLNEEVDVFVIDTSPGLSLLNQIIFLGADYFTVPMMPDAFSVQGIENLGTMYEKWKQNWKVTGKALSGNTENKYVLSGEGLFIGYIINSYNVYAKQPIKDHRHWIEEIPQKVKTYLAEKHGRNGLVEQSWKNPLAIIQDYGRIPAKCQEVGMAIFDLDPDLVEEVHQGTKENIEKSKLEFAELSQKILKILAEY
ncbi:MAG: Cobyrinic acid ac-diamide synthase [Parcubacteria group bacterium GW2011_GWC2_39_14]|nr:MAG: Cobyrinic acid ac-diamide synthase [Parcubacteria group bacterium GW2011_GWC2_39_14]KKR54221.1 MAG: Cobyrinic acid ac-diamide synthase [Parcubacteria group bacterium GW2011_GWA2_40_23]